MRLHLCWGNYEGPHHLDVPLREHNTLLLTAGYAPRYAETPLDAPTMTRVRAALRRAPSADGAGPMVEVIEVGDVKLDAARHEVFVNNGLVPLPLKEFELLELLLLNAGRVLTRDVLIDRIWGPNYYGDTKTLDVHIKRLRAKLELDAANPTRIVTVRGVGYRYEKT